MSAGGCRWRESRAKACARVGAMDFPKDWPDGCPPPDAEDATGDVFRVVKHNPPEPADLLSYIEMGRRVDARPCLRRGVSVFREFEGAAHLRKTFPQMGRFIPKGALQPEHGKTKSTGKQPLHTTWWSYEGVNRASLFSVISEEG